MVQTSVIFKPDQNISKQGEVLHSGLGQGTKEVVRRWTFKRRGKSHLQNLKKGKERRGSGAS